MGEKRTDRSGFAEGLPVRHRRGGGYGEYDAAAVAGRLLSDDERKQRKELIDQIRYKGYDQVMEEAAYTWFNRFIALRFMKRYIIWRIRISGSAMIWC